jgi:hypothetical protein
LSAALCVGLALAACGEEPEETSVAAASPPHPPAIHLLARLSVTDHIAPEQWLASRQAARDLPEDDASVVAMKQTLEIAGRRFRDYPRMIANRAVQLEAMLREQNLSEPAPQLIEVLSGVPHEARYVESFAALCQQYYNLRLQGLDRQAALTALSNPGTRTSGQN